MTTKEKILEVLQQEERPLAVHEFAAVPAPYRWVIENGLSGQGKTGRDFIGGSENAISARLRELRAAGKVKAQTREGKPFKEWSLA